MSGKAVSPAAGSLAAESGRLVLACPVCAGPRLHYLASLEAHRLVRCDDCGLVLLNPQPPDARPGPAPDAHPGRGNGEPERGLLRRYTGVVPGRVEWWTAADLREGAPAGPPADAAILAGTLETCRDPRAALLRARERLAPDGVLLATARDLRSRLAPGGWEGTTPPLVCFSEATLESLLLQCGFGDIVALPGTALAPGLARDFVVLARRKPLRERKVLSVIVPVFNEAGTVAELLDRLLAHPLGRLDLEVVIVESRSTDGSREIVSRYAADPRVRLVLEDRPRGKGHAVRAGFAAMTGDFVLIQDADLEYDLEDYDALLEPLLAGREAFVMGSRHGGRSWKIRSFGGQPVQAFVMNLGHWFFAAVVYALYGLALQDPVTMFKVFRRDCLYGLTFECNRFDFDFELLLKLVRKGYRPVEIPVNYRSRSFAEGKKVSMWRDPWTWMRALVKYRLTVIDPLATVERLRAAGGA